MVIISKNRPFANSKIENSPFFNRHKELLRNASGGGRLLVADNDGFAGYGQAVFVNIHGAAQQILISAVGQVDADKALLTPDGENAVDLLIAPFMGGQDHIPGQCRHVIDAVGKEGILLAFLFS